jgi:two-component system sensor histidine kinase QseC
MSLLDRARSSLRGRLALGLVAGTGAVLTTCFVMLHLLIRSELYGQLDEGLVHKMSAVAAYAASHPGAENLAEYMPQFRTKAHEDYFQVWDMGGRTLSRSDSSAGRDLPRMAAAVGRPVFHDLTLPDGHRGRAISGIFALPEGDARGSLSVVTAEEVESLGRLEARIHVLLLGAAIVTLAAMLLIAWYSVNRGLRPVGDFARALEYVNPDDPAARLDSGPLPTELRPVASSFSALLGRLLEALARERRYARNVAHELRNPLAEIRLMADIGSKSADPVAMHDAVHEIGRTAEEMQQVVESLLALTRYEAGLEIPQPEPVDLAAELRRQACAMAGAIRERSLTIQFDAPREVWVHTDSALLRRLLANLLGNAVSHAPAGAAVQVAVSPDGTLRIANAAPNLAPGDVARLGERFFRIGNGSNGSHAGLGLSLASAIAKVLGLTLELALGQDTQLVASIRGFEVLSGTPGLGADPSDGVFAGGDE